MSPSGSVPRRRGERAPPRGGGTVRKKYRSTRKTQALVAATVVFAASGVLASQSTAAADPPGTLTAKQAQVRECHQGPASGRGVASFSVVAPSTGLVRVRLDPVDKRAERADWDVAVFDEGAGRGVAASAATRSYEVADGNVTSGDHLRVQACRYAGNAPTVKVSTTFVATPATAAAGAATQLVAVNTPARADKTRL